MKKNKRKEPTLLIMAGGLGSRFHGLKQAEPLTEDGEILMEFAVFDAIRAGFKKAVFVIRKEMEEDFIERILPPMKKKIDCDYVVQELTQLPPGYHVPCGRVKPWGTCHAVWVAREMLNGPVAVINADDYYGREGFRMVYDFLTKKTEHQQHCLIGYPADHVLPEQGAVTRGVCKVSDSGHLKRICETKQMHRENGRILAGDEVIDGEEIVSMNFWGFSEEILEMLDEDFRTFLDASGSSLTDEYLLPIEVCRHLQKGDITVDVLLTDEPWYGVTYREDRDFVAAAFAEMKRNGKYPKYLWK